MMRIVIPKLLNKLEQTFGWNSKSILNDEIFETAEEDVNNELIVPKNLLTDLNKELINTQYEIHDNKISIFNNPPFEFDAMDKLLDGEKTNKFSDTQADTRTFRDRGVGPDIPVHPDTQRKINIVITLIVICRLKRRKLSIKNIK